MLINLPATGAFVANLNTGAWSTFANLDIQTMAVWGDRAYFGDGSGRVFEMETGGSDDGVPYSCRYSGTFDHLEMPGRVKTATLARAMFKSFSPVIPKVTVSKDYITEFGSNPNSPDDYSILSEWDVSEWDVGVWDAGTASTLTSRWQGIGRTGEVIAPQVQLTYGVTPLPKVELVGVLMTYIDGGVLA